jgi:putative phage-type endonuclease
MLRQNLIQNTPEWLSFRRHRIGASDAPIIMGVSPWRTPYQLWEEKLGLGSAQEENQAMRRGKDQEAEALEKYNILTMNFCEPGVFIHNKIYWMASSFDGVSPDLEIAVEIKCPGEEDHLIAKKGKVPEKYYPQLQHQLAVIDKKMLHYFSYRNGDFALVEVYRDEAYIDRLMLEEEKFYNHMMNINPPEMSDRDYIIKRDVSWLAHASRWQILLEKKKMLEREEKEIRESLENLSEGLNCRGGGIKISHSKRKGNIDYKSIPQLCGLDLEKYRKPDLLMIRIYEDNNV